MPRANRFSMSGHVWHITHRCHKKDFLLKFARDRKRWVYWLFEAKKRYGLSVLNYIVTSNHIHLLVYDSGNNEIAKSMQLIAARTAQEFNKRKNRKGAFWEDRYHATAIDTHEHLLQCLTYIDMNMVRAGVVKHPSDWPFSGYNAIQKPLSRYAIIDMRQLTEICGFKNIREFQEQHHFLVEQQLHLKQLHREAKWSETVAIGGEQFIKQVKDTLGIKVRYRDVVGDSTEYQIKEPLLSYSVDFDSVIALLRDI